MEFNINFNINPIVVKLDVNPQFTQAICFLASAFGYPGKTIANELKETAKEAKAKAEEQQKQMQAPKQEEPKQETPKQEQVKSVENWTEKNITPVLSGYLKKGVTNDDMRKELKKFKDKNNNPIQGIKQLIQEKGKEEIDQFLKALQVYFKEGDENG